MARGRKGKGFVVRYTMPVLADQEAMIQAELKYQREQEEEGVRCTAMGPLLANLAVEAILARMKARGIEPSQMPAVKPGDTVEAVFGLRGACHAGVDPLNDADDPVPKRSAAEDKALCDCGADRTGPSAEAHAESCPAAGPAEITG